MTTYEGWNKNLKDNLEHGAIALEHLEVELLIDVPHDVDHATNMPPPSSNIVNTSRI
jgi:hypothetical protein